MWNKGLLMTLAMLLLPASAALALDVRDVNNMLANGVPEPVIINMIRDQRATFNLTPRQAEDLSRRGASPNLINAMRGGRPGFQHRPEPPRRPGPGNRPGSHYRPEPPRHPTPPPHRPGPQYRPEPPHRPEPAPSRPVQNVTPAPLVKSFPIPPLGNKQGWLSVSNRDWTDYSLMLDLGDEKIYLAKGAVRGGVVVPSGSTITLPLKKDDWEVHGAGPDKLEVDVREGAPSMVDLEPFGPVGASGLRATANDGRRIRTAVLFPAAIMPVVVAPPPPVIVTRPPVIVTRPPVIVRPPPPPPPVVVERKPGWGFSFFMD